MFIEVCNISSVKHVFRDMKFLQFKMHYLDMLTYIAVVMFLSLHFYCFVMKYCYSYKYLTLIDVSSSELFNLYI